MLDCGGKKCGYTSSDDSSECETSSDDEEEETQRQVELRKRARAQLEAERARNGVKTAPAAKSRHAPAAVAERRRK